MIKGYLSLSAYCMVHKEVLVQLLSYLLFRASDVDSEMYIIYQIQANSSLHHIYTATKSTPTVS